MSSAQGLFNATKTLMAAAKAATATTKTSAAAAKTTAAKRKPRSKPASEPRKLARATGILKVSPVSAPLHEFLGVPAVSRTDAVKKVWEYVKLHNLQIPTDKRVILCDDKLKTIFEGKEKVGFLEIGKLLSRHFVKTEV